jgi:hypothetical protein
MCFMVRDTHFIGELEILMSDDVGHTNLSARTILHTFLQYAGSVATLELLRENGIGDKWYETLFYPDEQFVQYTEMHISSSVKDALLLHNSVVDRLSSELRADRRPDAEQNFGVSKVSWSW